MDPTTQFCHNPDCPLRGQVGQGNIGVLSHKEQRHECSGCQRSFAATKGTPFYRLRMPVETVTLMLTLLCHGCPLQAIVAAFGFDERTVADWQARAGQHGKAVHERIVAAGQVDVQHVQADEIRVKMVGKRVWLAMALAVPARLWLGGVISGQRDHVLITGLVQMIRRCARSPAVLVGVAGLASYVSALVRVFRTPAHTRRRGRPRLIPEEGVLIGQVVKQHPKGARQRHVVSVTRRVVQETPEAIAAVLTATGGGTGINTAYIERVNATFRSCLVPLVRRGRALAHKEAVLTAAIYRVGCAYNFCWTHASLRQPAGPTSGRRWQERTPAVAARLTDHGLTMSDLLHYQIPLPAWVPPKRRGRPPKRTTQHLSAVAA